MRARLIAIACCLGSSVAWCASLPKASKMAERPTVAENYLFLAANAERAQRGLQPLRWDSGLYKAATYHARLMVEQGTISHQFEGEPDVTARGAATGVQFSLIEENVAEAPTAMMIQQGWMNSPGHRANMLDPQVDSVAIRVMEGRGGELYAVEDFDRSVAALSLSEQESQVERLVKAKSTVQVLPTTADARKTCALDSIVHEGRIRPRYVLWYTSADLNELPSELEQQLVRGRYRAAEVGACSAQDPDGFAAYNIAVMLYQ